jgi:hypothetical protein
MVRPTRSAVLRGRGRWSSSRGIRALKRTGMSKPTPGCLRLCRKFARGGRRHRQRHRHSIGAIKRCRCRDVGTRFVATKESFAHQEYKNPLLRADKGDTVLTVCFEGGWPNSPHRMLRNETFIRWDAAGCPPVGKRPREGDVVATWAYGGNVLR